MREFGLIGFPLSHSFSKKYFSEKFEKEGIDDANYELYELPAIADFATLLNTSGSKLCGLNVTIPYKQEVIPFLNEMEENAQKIGAVNVIKFRNGKLKGYNSDYFGFKKSLEELLGNVLPEKALVLGTGGASKAVVAALETLGIAYQYVSRVGTASSLAYEEVSDELIKASKLIINTTPLGMLPNTEACPAINYEQVSTEHYLFDLVYNPLETKFMQLGQAQGAKVKNGLDMLIYQAEKAWEIWNGEQF